MKNPTFTFTFTAAKVLFTQNFIIPVRVYIVAVWNQHENRMKVTTFSFTFTFTVAKVLFSQNVIIPVDGLAVWNWHENRMKITTFPFTFLATVPFFLLPLSTCL